jgi:hypothetical protein
MGDGELLEPSLEGVVEFDACGGGGHGGLQGVT